MDLKNKIKLSVIASLLITLPILSSARVQIPKPNPAELSPPSVPGLPAAPGTQPTPQKPPRVIAACNVINTIDNSTTNVTEQAYSIKVYKQNQTKSAGWAIADVTGVQHQSNSDVYTKLLTKEMLGQYSAAVSAMQALGITQVDSLKIFFLDINPKQPLLLIFFYDGDGDIIDRTVSIKNHWLRCLEE